MSQQTQSLEHNGFSMKSDLSSTAVRPLSMKGKSARCRAASPATGGIVESAVISESIILAQGEKPPGQTGKSPISGFRYFNHRLAGYP
jgi:hypothetical protein